MDATRKAFGGELYMPAQIKFAYIDNDGDRITISSQDDLEECYDCSQAGIKLEVLEAVDSSQ